MTISILLTLSVVIIVFLIRFSRKMGVVKRNKSLLNVSFFLSIAASAIFYYLLAYGTIDRTAYRVVLVYVVVGYIGFFEGSRTLAAARRAGL